MRKSKQVIAAPLIGGALGYAYGKVLSELGFGLSGTGHGTAIFGMAAYGPGGLALYLWVVLGALVGLSRFGVARMFGRVFLIIYYVWLMVYIVSLNSDLDRIPKVASAAPMRLTLDLILYIIGQALLLYSFFHHRLDEPVRASPMRRKLLICCVG